eukprot:6174698-Pleurochrysis_carterae.AAC.1
MTEPARTVGSGLSHPPTIPGAAGVRTVRREARRKGGLTPHAGAGGCIGTAPTPSSEGQGD